MIGKHNGMYCRSDGRLIPEGKGDDTVAVFAQVVERRKIYIYIFKPKLIK